MTLMTVDTNNPSWSFSLEKLSKESRQTVLESGLVASQLAGLVFPDFNPVQVENKETQNPTF